MHLDTSSVMLPGVSGCFGSSNNHTPLPRGHSRGWSSPLACFQVARLSSPDPQPLWCNFMLPRWPSSWPFADWPLRYPTYRKPCRGTGSHLTRHMLPWYSFTNSACFALFLSLFSSLWSSQVTVSYRKITCLEDSEISTMSDLSIVMETVAVAGNLSCFPRLTYISWSFAVASRPEEVVLAADVSVSPALTKVMVFFIGWRHLQ